MYGAPKATFEFFFFLTQYIELKKRLISLIGDIYTFHFLLLVFRNNVIKKNIKLLVSLVIRTRFRLFSKFKAANYLGNS